MDTKAGVRDCRVKGQSGHHLSRHLFPMVHTRTVEGDYNNGTPLKNKSPVVDKQPSNQGTNRHQDPSSWVCRAQWNNKQRNMRKVSTIALGTCNNSI